MSTEPTFADWLLDLDGYLASIGSPTRSSHFEKAVLQKGFEQGLSTAEFVKEVPRLRGRSVPGNKEPTLNDWIADLDGYFESSGLAIRSNRFPRVELERAFLSGETTAQFAKRRCAVALKDHPSGQTARASIPAPLPPQHPTNSNSAAGWLVLAILAVPCIWFGNSLGCFGNSYAEEDKPQRASQKAPMPVDPARGPRPVPSEWDGMTPEVGEWFDANLRDRRSLEIVEAYKVIEHGPTTWAQRLKYRAKNGFGGYNLEERLFIIDHGRVVDTIDLGELEELGR